MSKSEISAEIAAIEKKLLAVPHGSRHVGGWTDKSDYDYFFEGSDHGIQWLKKRGYERQFATGYFDGDEVDEPGDDVSLVAYRHPTLPIQVLALSHDYYPVYYAANELVKSMEGAAILETREGRVTTYKHFIAKARELVEERM